MEFTNSITLCRPRDEVFAYLSEFENLPTWNYAISRTSRVGTGPVGVGARYLQTRTLPKPAEEAFEVVAFAPPEQLAIRGVLGPFRADSSYLLESDRDATVLTNSMVLEATGVMRVAASLAGSRVRTAVAANLQVLKELLERQ